MNAAHDEARAVRIAARDAGIKPEVTPEELGISLESVDDLLKRVTSSSSTPQAGWRPPRRIKAFAVGALVAASITTVLVVQPWHTTSAVADTPPILDYQFASARQIAYAPGKDATAALLALSDAARHASTAKPAGTVQHVLMDAWFANIDNQRKSRTSRVALVPQIEESWLTPYGAVETRETRGKPLAADGRGLPQSLPGINESTDGVQSLPASTLPSHAASDLPSDPAAMSAALAKAGGCSSTDIAATKAHCMYQAVSDLNSKYVVSPRTAAAIWRALATEKTFRLLGQVRDRANRAGVGISLIPGTHSPYRLVLIVSPSTGQLLGTEEILIKQQPDISTHAPAIFAFTSITESDYVESPPK